MRGKSAWTAENDIREAGRCVGGGAEGSGADDQVAVTVTVDVARRRNGNTRLAEGARPIDPESVDPVQGRQVEIC